MKSILSCISLLFCLFTAGCVSAPNATNLTDQEVSTHGSKIYQGSTTVVHKAALDALKSLGYEIAVNRPEKGLIVTGRLPVRQAAVARGDGAGYVATATAVTYYRQYTINVHKDGTATKIVARPSVFAGANDISKQQVWAIEGPEGERTLWSKFFQTVDQLL